MGPAVARLCVGHAGVADDTVERRILRAEADDGDLGIGACSADAGFSDGLGHGMFFPISAAAEVMASRVDASTSPLHSENWISANAVSSHWGNTRVQ